MTDLLFDTPWWLPSAIILLGVAIWFQGNRRVHRLSMRIGLGVAGVGVLLFAVSYFVETEKEKVTRLTREFINAVVARDWAKVESLMDPNVVFRNQSVVSVAESDKRENLLLRARERTEQSGLKDIAVQHIAATKAPMQTSVDARLIATFEGKGYGKLSADWRFVWVKTSGQWQMTELHLVQINPFGSEAGALR